MQVGSSYLNRRGDVGYLGKEKSMVKALGDERKHKVFRIKATFNPKALRTYKIL